MKRPAPVLMWAAIVPGKRITWIHTGTLRSTRVESQKAYRQFWRPEHQATVIKDHGITFERVVVSMELP